MTGKRKNKKDNALPVRVYRGRSAYEWKPMEGGTVRLCALDAPISEVWRAYERETQEAEAKSNFKWLVKGFFESADFEELSKETRKDYRKHYRKCGPVFDHVHIDKIEPQHIRIYMDKRGLSSRTQANREKSFMSRVFRWGYERGLCRRNPCEGVRQFKEKARTRYVTDIEYQAVYDNACNVVKVAMELAYLCCARQQDVLALRLSHLSDEGIFIRQGKTGVEQIKLWSPRLEAAIKLSKTLPAKFVRSMFVVSKPCGGKFSRDGFNSRWRKAKKAAIAATGLPCDWTYHDLKGKGISDLEGTIQEKQAISGHKHASQTAKYDRKVKKVAAVDGQKKK